ncbi:MAG: hypothetical protein E7315_02705 [Clostridiales bacterium]|nr:hypothetical protein [Clostridiales bacterium]
MKKIRIKKLRAVICIFLLSALIFTGCSQQPTPTGEAITPPTDTPAGVITTPQTESEVTVYYADSNSYIVPVSTKIKWTEGLAHAVIKAMMNSPEQKQQLITMGLQSLIPSKVTLNGLDVHDGLARVDFSINDAVFDSVIAEENFVHGVVLALTALPTVDEVQLMFDSSVIDELPMGTRVGEPLSAPKINLEDTGVEIAEDNAVSVFYYTYSSTNYEYMVPITRYIDKTNPGCEDAIRELLNGPTELSGLSFTLPSGCELISVQMIGDTACLFFNDCFNDLKLDTLSERGVLRSITLTCAQFDNVKRVKIYAGDKEFSVSDELDFSTAGNVGK